MNNLAYLKELIKKKLSETSITGGTASTTPGTGEGVATKYAYSNKKIKSVKDTAYASLGFKDANPDVLSKKQKGIEYKHLWKSKLNEDNFNVESYVNSLNTQDANVKQHVTQRMKEFEEIEIKLNILIPLLQKAKQQTVDYYKQRPSTNDIYSTELAVEYLNDLIKLFKK